MDADYDLQFVRPKISMTSTSSATGLAPPVREELVEMRKESARAEREIVALREENAELRHKIAKLQTEVAAYSRWSAKLEDRLRLASCSKLYALGLTCILL